jgi:outer membrane lipoprotein SlyB
MKTNTSFTPAVIALTVLVLAGCAHTGSRSPNARPVLYPNATLKQVGDAKAAEEIGACMAEAEHAGLTPDEKDNAVGHGAAKGAAVVGTVGAVGALVRGRSVESAVSSGAKGAVVGAAAGAVAGSFQEKPNMTFRHFVQRCLSEKGFEVIGWN